MNTLWHWLLLYAGFFLPLMVAALLTLGSVGFGWLLLRKPAVFGVASAILGVGLLYLAGTLQLSFGVAGFVLLALAIAVGHGVVLCLCFAQRPIYPAILGSCGGVLAALGILCKTAYPEPTVMILTFLLGGVPVGSSAGAALITGLRWLLNRRRLS